MKVWDKSWSSLLMNIGTLLSKKLAYDEGTAAEEYQIMPLVRSGKLVLCKLRFGDQS